MVCSCPVRKEDKAPTPDDDKEEWMRLRISLFDRFSWLWCRADFLLGQKYPFNMYVALWHAELSRSQQHPQNMPSELVFVIGLTSLPARNTTTVARQVYPNPFSSPSEFCGDVCTAAAWRNPRLCSITLINGSHCAGFGSVYTQQNGNDQWWISSPAYHTKLVVGGCQAFLHGHWCPQDIKRLRSSDLHQFK